MTINKEGHWIILIAFCIVAALVAVIFVWLPQWAGWIMAASGLIFWGFVVSFFRHPRRDHITDKDVVFAPADGKVVVVEEVEETEFLGERRIQVSVFMSVTNVHVNWYPVGGKVVYYKYHPGKFLVAWHPKSSELNERTTTVVDTGRHMVLFRQIAGFVARRIVSYAKAGEAVSQNSVCGFIKFGSRIDIFLPLDSEILVKIGDCTIGSQTRIARLKQS